MTLPNDFIFSQTSLQDAVECLRRFELKYLLRQRFPALTVDDIESYERDTRLGEQFHRLVHQHLVGIPSELLQSYVQDEPMRNWLDAYLVNGLTDVPENRYPEMTLAVSIGHYTLMAKYDLLAIDDSGNRAIIIDWKTSSRLPTVSQLERRLQTIVYRYVLASGGLHLNNGRSIDPNNIEMRYWYVAQGGTRVALPYSQVQYEADSRFLSEFLDSLSERRVFPMVENERICKFCVYRSLCNRGIKAGLLSEFDEQELFKDEIFFEIDVTQIGEIEF